MLPRVAILLFLLSHAAFAAGPTAVADSPADLPKGPPPPPVPLLSAEDAIKTCKLPPGFRMEVVATEAFVQHPVAMTFDPDGRIWVVVMRSYMPDVEGNGEDAPTGRVSVLEDTDGDGRMDKSTVFLDNLVLPRAIAMARDGVLVAVPPKLLFCRDTNGDLKCDEQTVVATDYGLRGNPEHMPNGLLYNLDNWTYSANYDKRLRYIAGAWVAEFVPELGQWGISQDDVGRLDHNSNPDQLRGSLFPPHYATRNPNYRATAHNEQIAKDQSVYPAHATAIDRGYLDNIMRPDGTLRNFTAACAPVIYRGGLFPKEFDGNAFVCEPAANLIKRNLLTRHPDGTISAKHAYENAEFLTSTYERFRPVNLNVGLDGALYVIDMHHGLLQHKAYLTTYCREQYEMKELDKHLMTGRIYRIVPEHGLTSVAATTGATPRHLSNAKVGDLVALLADSNGQLRDTAQRLLVDRGDLKAISLLRTFARKSVNPLGRLHAMWTLEGFRVNDPNVILPALGDADARVRAAAVRLAEPLLSSPLRDRALPAVLKLAADPDAAVRVQLALSVASLGLPETDAALARLLADHANSPLLRDAVLTGVRGRELDLLTRLLGGGGKSGGGDSDEWSRKATGRDVVLTALSRGVVQAGTPQRVVQLLDLIAKQPTANWRQLALLDGFPPPPDAAKKLTRRQQRQQLPKPRPVVLESAPAELLALARSDNDEVKDKLDDVLRIVHWPGQPGYKPPPPPRPLTPAEQARFERGRIVYSQTCAACHKPDGQGQEGMAPPLLDSEWALGRAETPARIVLHGLRGPINVGGRTFNLDMPGLPKLSDEDIAAALTYVRREWGHTADPVTPETVRKQRATSRPTQWTERELLQQK
jgi:mono/diheme cytochrome c family protein/glucose/arabinose dehydrogenase